MNEQGRLTLTENEGKYPSYEDLMILKGRVDAAVSYYETAEYPDEDVMIAILGFAPKAK